jgi:hypothetical protein
MKIPFKLNNMEMIHLVKEKKTISNQFQDLMSQPHFGLSVRVKPTLTKVGTWSPPGLPKI